VFEKLPIVSIFFTLDIKILENTLYIVIKVGIRIYFGDLKKTRIF